MLGNEIQKLIEAMNYEGMTTFMCAAQGMHHKIMEFLVTECLWNIYAANSKGQNALHITVINKDIKGIWFLLWLDADKSLLNKGIDEDSRTPLDYADKYSAVLLNAEEFKEGSFYLLFICL